MKLGFWERVYIVALYSGVSIEAVQQWKRRGAVPKLRRETIAEKSQTIAGAKLSLGEMKNEREN